jgi:hypothetical protein
MNPDHEHPSFLTGVLIGDFRAASRVPLIKNKAGSSHGHQVHSTVTAL